MTLAQILAAHPRIAISGGPKGGKSSLAALVHDRPVLHTDSLTHLPWDQVASEIISRHSSLPRFALEGVHAIHAVRKGLPVDAVIFQTTDKAHQHIADTGGHPLSPKQLALHKAQATVLAHTKAKFPHLPVYTDISAS